MSMGERAIIEHFKERWQEFYAPLMKGPLRGVGAGREFLALCPFHQDTEPSLSVNGENGTWCCHAEKTGGNAFSFWAELKGLTPERDGSHLPTRRRNREPGNGCWTSLGKSLKRNSRKTLKN